MFIIIIIPAETLQACKDDTVESEERKQGESWLQELVNITSLAS